MKPSGRRETFSIQLLLLLDAALVWLAFGIASELRGPVRKLFGWDETEIAGLSEMSWVLYLVVPFTPLILEFFGFYERSRTKTIVRAISQLGRGIVVVGMSIAVLSIFAKLGEASRLILGLGALWIFILLILRERFLHWHLKGRDQRDDLKERIVIAGSDEEIDRFLDETDGDLIRALLVVDRFDLETGTAEQLYALLKKESIERVIFTASGTEFGKLAEAVEICELQGVEAWIAAGFIRTQIAKPTFDLIGRHPMLVLKSTPETSWELLLKSCIDRVGAFLLIVCTLPLWIFAYLGIKIGSPGAPVFFAQKRAGRYGKSFKMWKFRTMVPNAEALLAEIKESHGNGMDGPVFKLENDPRIFPFGRMLRKLSIDELPQLLNVLVGHMSLVGPRPLPLYEVDAFKKSEHRRRLSVKPGITCEWQVGGRNKISSFEEWVEMDLRYIDNWSILLDISILLRTIPAVLFGRGAS